MTNTFNSKDFNIQDLIKTRVNREAEVEWSKNQTIESPKFTKPKRVTFSAGVYNFIRSNVLELRP